MTVSYTKTWTEENLDTGGFFEVAHDATAEVEKLIRDKAAADVKVAALQKEITDIKSRRYWEEIKMVTDERTGMSAVTLVTYKWQAEHMRLDFSRDMMGSMGYPR